MTKTSTYENQYYYLKQQEPVSLRGWLEVFPTAKDYLIEKLETLKAEHLAKSETYQKLFKETEKMPEQDQWFGKAVAMEFVGKDILEIENEIKKISDSLGPTKKVRSELKDEMIVRARQREMKPVYESVLGPVKGYVVRCPFHKNGQEKHASLNIKGSHYFCHCCGEKGNPIDFLMKVSGLSFKDAVMALQ